MLDKIKYQFLAILIAAIIGAGIGYYTSSSKANKQIKILADQHATELKDQVEADLKKVQERDLAVKVLEEKVKGDSVMLLNLSDQIAKSRIDTEKLRVKASKFTSDEKRNYLLNRYSTK